MIGSTISNLFEFRLRTYFDNQVHKEAKVIKATIY